MAICREIDTILDDTDALLSHFATDLAAVENDETLMSKICQLRVAHGRFLELVAQMYSAQSDTEGWVRLYASMSDEMELSLG